MHDTTDCIKFYNAKKLPSKEIYPQIYIYVDSATLSTLEELVEITVHTKILQVGKV